MQWRLLGALFGRRDDDLVDWTYRQGAPFLRQANAVDIDVRGAELMLARYGEMLDLVVAYGWIDKEADYGGTPVDASYYALNYARHRATLALLLRPLRWLDIRLDSEYRRQQDNPLRNGRDEAFIAAFSISSQLPFMENTQAYPGHRQRHRQRFRRVSRYPRSGPANQPGPWRGLVIRLHQSALNAACAAARRAIGTRNGEQDT